MNPSVSRRPNLPLATPWSLPDTLALVLLALAAAGPRFWSFATLGLDHYDAGGYALAAAAVARGTAPVGFLPLQHLLSPPLYFILAGLGMKLSGSVSDTSLLVISAVLGTLTVPLLFMLGRLWFGRPAGLAAAALLALSDFHILFSRAALTDATFLFWLLLAVGLFAHAEQRRSLLLALVAGLVTGLAWDTKYHGWFAVVIAGGALFPALRPWNRWAFTATLVRLAAAAAVAGLIYLPWFLYVQDQPGGYARLAEEHARFLSEWSRFPRHALTQVENQAYLAGFLSHLAPAAAFLLAALARPGAPFGLLRIAAWTLALAAAGVSGYGLHLAAAAVLVGLAVPLFRRQAGLALPLVLLVLFGVTTPLYHPYARLMLPLSAAAMLWAGAGLQSIARYSPPRPAASRLTFLPAGIIIVFSAALLLRAADQPPASPGLEPSGGLRSVVTGIKQVGSDRAGFAVIGEPALVFYLREAGARAVHLDHPEEISRFFDAGQRAVVVEGLYARRTGELSRWLKDRGVRAEELGRVRVDVGPARLLDDVTPKSAETDPRVARIHDLRLFGLAVPGN